MKIQLIHCGSGVKSLSPNSAVPQGAKERERERERRREKEKTDS
jgi:hypothetical protein